MPSYHWSLCWRWRWRWCCWARRRPICSTAPAPRSSTRCSRCWWWCMRRSVQFDRFAGSIDELFTVYRENLVLKDENARLKQWRNVAVVMQDRVKRYQSLLHAVPDPDVHSVLSQVIGRANRPFLQTMILDAGSASNVKPGEAVVDARGMIGRILSHRKPHQLGDPAHRSQQPHSRRGRARQSPGHHGGRQYRRCRRSIPCRRS